VNRFEEELNVAQKALASRQDELSTQIQYTLMERLQAAEQRVAVLEEELVACSSADDP
jgi:hypothetical protein